MIFFIEFESFDDESSKLQEVQETVILSEETTAIYLELKNNDVSGIVNSSTTIQEEIDETNVSKEKKVFAEEQCNDEIDCPDSESSKPLENKNDMDELNAPQSTSTPRVDARGSSDDYDAVTDNNNVLWPDINSDEERYPSNEPFAVLKKRPIYLLNNDHPLFVEKMSEEKKSLLCLGHLLTKMHILMENMRRRRRMQKSSKEVTTKPQSELTEESMERKKFLKYMMIPTYILLKRGL